VAAASEPATFLVVLPLIILMGVFAREHRSRIDSGLELGHAYRGTAFLLGDVVEANDAYTGSHSRDVVQLSLAVAERLALQPRECRSVELTALLHDIGKISVPRAILHKLTGLSPEERELMRGHTIEGERMLRQVGGQLSEIGAFVR